MTRSHRPGELADAADAPLTAEEQAAYDRQGELIALELRWEDALRAAGHAVPSFMDGVRWGNNGTSSSDTGSSGTKSGDTNSGGTGSSDTDSGVGRGGEESDE